MDQTDKIEGIDNKAFEDYPSDADDPTNRKLADENIKHNRYMFENTDSCDNSQNKQNQSSSGEYLETTDQDSSQFKEENSAKQISTKNYINLTEEKDSNVTIKEKTVKKENSNKSVYLKKDAILTIAKSAVLNKVHPILNETEHITTLMVEVCNDCSEKDTLKILNVDTSDLCGKHNTQKNNFKNDLVIKSKEEVKKMPDNSNENGVSCKINSTVFKYVEEEESKSGENCEECPSLYRCTGTFRSFRENKVKNSWRRGSLGEELKSFCKLKESTPELNRSQYSLVSCAELTPGAVQLWLELPDEVKYDPALAQFRQLYEKEYGKDESRKNGKPGRLPLVSSAPHLNNNVVPEDVFFKIGTDPPALKKEPLLVNSQNEKKESRMAKAGYLVKMTLLLSCWLFFTAVFLMFNEKERIELSTFVNPGETKRYILRNGTDQLSVGLKLYGPFLSDNAQEKLNDTQLLASRTLDVWIESRPSNKSGHSEQTRPWSLVLLDDSYLDFSSGEKRTSTLHLQPTNSNASFDLVMRTTTNATVPVKLSYNLNPLDLTTGVIYSCLLLCGLYGLIIFEVMNRTMAAVLMSTTALATLAIAGERPSVEEVVSWLDVETLLLLFSMMLLVAIMAETGMFDFLAVFTFEVTKGKLWPLITLLCAITAVLSTFLDNVTTVLLMTPVTIRLCEVMDLDPIPILMSMVLFSNIGGTATPVGDPPNVIIASNKAVIQAGVNFTNFTLHMFLGILLVCVQTYIQLRFMFRDTNKLRICVPRDIQEHRHQIAIWKRAADSLPHLSKDVHIVRERLERKVRKLQTKLETMEKEANKRACPKDTFQSTLGEMKDKYKIRDKMLLVKSTVAISFVVAVFFLHSIPELNRVSLGWTALLGAILLLILADREDLEPILHRVEWSTLLFFAALFVLMEALSKLGLIEYIGGLTEALILKVDESARLAVAILLMLWVSGITSAFVDNIPLTTMMVRVVTSLGSNPRLNLPMMPLIWALSFGACLGGNGTLIGASANVVCAGVAEQHGYKFTFMQFFKIGFPIMIGHLIVASAYLLLCHCAFTWH